MRSSGVMLDYKLHISSADHDTWTMVKKGYVRVSS